jgi:hypothetical protein
MGMSTSIFIAAVAPAKLPLKTDYFCLPPALKRSGAERTGTWFDFNPKSEDETGCLRLV